MLHRPQVSLSHPGQQQQLDVLLVKVSGPNHFSPPLTLLLCPWLACIILFLVPYHLFFLSEAKEVQNRKSNYVNLLSTIQ